ncbi:fibroblast growth factor 1-like [Lycorma delicatula]|uniref:fibroblast growth factor 1-like n=1 Tax=Lycorma delicatula TaxID=130591 RepID=UPI003F5172FE
MEKNNSSSASTSTDSSSSSTVHSPPPIPNIHNLPFREGNVKYGFRMRLYCRTGFHLIILPDGKVQGTEDETNKYAIMEFSSAGIGEVRIRGEEANLYLAMNKKGKLYGEPNKEEQGTIFVEGPLGQYNTYLSRKFGHLGWYVGIKKSGKHKPGNRTRWGQKSIQFLPRRLES